MYSGVGLTYYATKRPTDGVLVSSQVLVGIGGAISMTSSYVAVQASVPHQDMGIAIAVLNLWSSVGSSIAIAISASVWNKQVPAKLERYVGDVLNATARAEIFGDILIARAAEPRDLIRKGKPGGFGTMLTVSVPRIGRGFVLVSAHRHFCGFDCGILRVQL
jgi:hypothetical protein